MQIVDFIKSLKSKLLPEQVLTDPDSLNFYGKDWLAIYEPLPLAIVFPRTTDEVSQIIKLANEFQVAVVPSGGRTGLSGGATALNGEIVVSLEKLNQIFGFNEYDRAIHCQAGVTTKQVQEYALENGFYYPVDFGSSGSSQIGGNIATNAGGIHVIRYGLTREWVLGLQVVTGTGEILNLNGPLYKNQSGYDLKSLMIGSEGTLGIVTEAYLKVTTKPASPICVFCGLNSKSQALNLLLQVRKEFPELAVFEFLERNGLEKVLTHKNIKDPLPDKYECYVVIEIDETTAAVREKVEEFFCQLMEEEVLAYVVMSQSSKQASDLMSLRELLPETLSNIAVLYKNDLSVPISNLSEFLEFLSQDLSAIYQNSEVVIFGHLGDGNIHVNVLKPAALAVSDFREICKTGEKVLFEKVKELRGSISAEHGVGILKREKLEYTRTPTEIEIMRQIKKVLDPQGILNPGKIF